MQKKVILTIIIWLVILIAFAAYIFNNIHATCYDGMLINPETGEPQPVGGCSSNYSVFLQLMVWPFVIWLFILLIVLFVIKKLEAGKKK